MAIAVLLGWSSAGHLRAEQPQPPEAGAIDLQAIKHPVVGRVEIPRQQLRSVDVFVPRGTRCYFVGRLGDEKPDVLAWYNAATKQLVAAIEVRVVDKPLRAADGVKIDAGRNVGGKAPALLTINSAQTTRALLRPAGPVTLQAAGQKERMTVAPLLSMPGSSHLTTLAAPQPVSMYQAKSFNVETRDATGEPYQRDLPNHGGDVPLVVNIASPVRPGQRAKVTVINNSDQTKYWQGKPAEGEAATWDDGTQAMRELTLAPGASASPGAIIPQTPGPKRMHYTEQTVGDPQLEELVKLKVRELLRQYEHPCAEGPVVTDARGYVEFVMRGAQIDGVSTDQAGARANVTRHGSGGSSELKWVGLGAAGVVGAVPLLFKLGERQLPAYVTAVPMAEPEPGLADVVAVAEAGPLPTLAFAPQDADASVRKATDDSVCCCCVEDVKVNIALPKQQIIRVKRVTQDHTQIGHVLTTTIDLAYKIWTSETFGDCILQWWEKTDHEKSLVDGQRLDEWIDKFSHWETKGSFDKSWGARKRPCPGKETVPADTDPPGLYSKHVAQREKLSDKRSLDIVIRVLSAPGCPCDKPEKVVYLHQYLEVKDGKVSTQTMQELQPEHFQGNPPQPWKE